MPLILMFDKEKTWGQPDKNIFSISLKMPTKYDTLLLIYVLKNTYKKKEGKLWHWIKKKKKKNLIARAKCNKSLKVETSLKEDNVTEEVKKKKKKAYILHQTRHVRSSTSKF